MTSRPGPNDPVPKTKPVALKSSSSPASAIDEGDQSVTGYLESTDFLGSVIRNEG